MVERDENGRFVKGANIKDISGNRYGKLVAVRFEYIRNRKSYWLCQCDCGKQKIIRSDCLPKIQSCGCVKKEQDTINLKIENPHGMTHHRAYHIWVGMMTRCFNPNSESYKDYGGRGITVCKEWKDPRVFCKWMDNNKFETGLSVERKDVNGNYDPKNCILIPKNEQVYNRRNTVYLMTDKGVVALAKEARKNGISYKIVHNRVKRGLWRYDDLFSVG